MRCNKFHPGELVGVHSGYDTGIWLRKLEEEMDVINEGRTLPNETLVVIESKGDNIKVVNRQGIMGWTWSNRLQKLD